MLGRELVKVYAELEAQGWRVVLIGLGSRRAALGFAEHVGFKGLVAVDPQQATYTALGFLPQPDAWKGLQADREARRQLKERGEEASMFLVGGGMLSAGQNGGVLAVRDGAVVWAYRSRDSGDMPAGSHLLQYLTIAH